MIIRTVHLVRIEYSIPKNEVIGVEKGTRLALVLPGAVSLGAYEAGAVYELLMVLGLFGEERPFNLDLIIGTSAGALTGALAAFSIARGESPLRLYEAWVHGLSLNSLLQRGPDEHGVLSGKSVMKVAERFLDAQHVARGGQAIRLAVTLTDLNGQWYQIQPTPGAAPIDALNFAEQRLFDLSPATSRRGWQDVREAACASAAFPGAFPAVPLTDRQGRRHWYTDGGVANRRLLEIAIDAARELDQEVSNQRLMLLIEPNPLYRPERDELDQPEPSWLDAIMRSALTIPFHNQIYEDLRRVVRINERVQMATALDQFLGRWVSALDGTLCAQMAEEINPLYRQAMRYHDTATITVWAQKRPTTAGVSARSAASTFDRLSQRQRELYEQWRFLIYSAAGLLDKTEITIDRIAPADGRTELAGDFWGHFGGLLRPAFREHDFRTGRQGARAWLRLQGVDYQFDEKDYETDPALGQMAYQEISTWEKLSIGARLLINGYRAATAPSSSVTS